MFIESAINGAHSLPFVLAGSFLAGILASFTPCIYPMIPITIGIITAQRAHSMLTNFFLSLSYGLGIASVYAALGYVSVKTNLMFGQWLANPWFIGANITLFLYLAGSMFGLYEMYTPQFAQANIGASRKGSYLYSFTFGIFTGAAASPCLTPALALLLSFAAKQQNPAVGIAVLFSFAMGLSSILITLGTFSSALSFLPRAGNWMNEIKKMFGFLLLCVCVSYLQPILDEYIIMLLYGLIGIAGTLHYLFAAQAQKKMRFFFLLLSTMLFLGSSISLYTAYQLFVEHIA